MPKSQWLGENKSVRITLFSWGQMKVKKESYNDRTANVPPLMRLSLNGTGPAAVKLFLFTIAFFLLITFLKNRWTDARFCVTLYV